MPAPEIGRVPGWSPSVQPRIDYGHPLARGLVHLVNGSGYDIARQSLATNVNVSERNAQWFTTNSVSGAGMKLGPRGGVNFAAGDFTLSVLCRFTPGASFQDATYSMLFGNRPVNYSNPTDEVSIMVTSTGVLQITYVGGNGQNFLGGQLIKDSGLTWTMCTIRRTGSTVDVLSDTTIIKTITDASTIATTDNMCIGGCNDTAFTVNGAQYSFFGAWTRYLDDGQIATLVADPNSMLVR